MLPKGLKLLKGPRQTEEDTINCLDECCAEHPRCRHKRECKRMYAIRCGGDPRFGGWAWPFENLYRVPTLTRRSDKIRYCDSLPMTDILREKVRVSPSGGMI